MLAVGGKVPVLFDGGVRRGTDVLKALALGAQAVLISSPPLSSIIKHSFFLHFFSPVPQCVSIGCTKRMSSPLPLCSHAMQSLWPFHCYYM